MQRNSIKVYYDDELQIDATDKDYKRGTIAVGSQDRAVYFDNIIVTGPKIPNWNMSPVSSMGKLATVWGKVKTRY